MCKVTVDGSTNPNFVLYNLVFSNNRIGKISSDNLYGVMKDYGIDMPEPEIRRKLSEWYMRGLLNTRCGDYVVARS